MIKVHPDGSRKNVKKVLREIEYELEYPECDDYYDVLIFFRRIILGLVSVVKYQNEKIEELEQRVEELEDENKCRCNK